MHFPPKRSAWAGWLPHLLANDILATKYGTLNGLLMASSVSMIGIGVLLTGWMEHVKPLAGWCTLGFLLACSPWIGMGRFLTFYPEIVFWLVFATVSMWFGLHSEAEHICPRTGPCWVKEPLSDRASEFVP